MIDWQRLIQERNKWIAYNFPDTPEEHAVLGVAEELGELIHHHIKEEASIRGEPAFHQAEAKDAIGDMTVYLLGVMTQVDLIPEAPLLEPSVWEQRRGTGPRVALLDLLWFVGQLAEDPPQKVQVAHTVRTLEHYCRLREWDYEAIVNETWERVKQRDWYQHPQDGSADYL